MKQFIKRKELIAVVVILFTAVAAFLILQFVTADQVAAEVTVAGEVVQLIDLSEDKIYSVDALLPVTLEVMDGAIRFVHSQCPDHTCEAFGWIDDVTEHAICLPARVAVQIVSK